MSRLITLEKPEMAKEAASRQKGMHWGMEILVFFAVFWVANCLEGICLIVGCYLRIFAAGGLEFLREGDVDGFQELSAQMMTSDPVIMLLQLFVTAFMIGAVFLSCRIFQKRPFRTLGFTKKGIVPEYLVGLAGGFAAFSAAVGICVATGALRLEGLSPTFSAGVFLLFVLGFMIQGMSEEVLCRGYFMISMARRYPIVVGILANSLIFGALHLANSGISVLAFVNLVLFGVFASLYFLRRGNIWGVAAFHTMWNLVQGNFYGIKVSGMEMQCSILQSAMTDGKELINGGEFGLEGGLAVTVVYTIGIVVLLLMKDKEKEGGIKEIETEKIS